MQALSPHQEKFQEYLIEDSWSQFCRIYKSNKLVWEFHKLNNWEETLSKAQEWVMDELENIGTVKITRNL